MEFPVKLGIVSFSSLLGMIAFGWIIFPKIMEYKIKQGMTLGPETDVRNLWQKFPFPITCSFYLFNITNDKEVELGGTPMLEEIGPYVFDEWREKINLDDNETEDSVSFNPVVRWVFNAEKSGKLTGDEIVTVPHPMITGILLTIASEKPEMLTLAYTALKSVFKDPESIFVKVRAMDLLFDGLYIDCNATDFFAQTACAQMRKEKSLVPSGDTGLLFSFFGFKNGSASARMKVNRGVVESSQVNQVIEFENKTELSVWPKHECNQLVGTEGSIFAPLRPERQGLLTFSTLLCGPLELYWLKSTTFHDIPAGLYTASLGDPSETKCTCPGEETCLKKGAVDLKRCMHTPLIVTFPHFYDADSSYLEGVRGLSPDEHKHRIEFHFNQLTGTALKAKTVIQFNYPIRPLLEIDIMENLTEAFWPALWIEEKIEIPEDKLGVIKNTVYRIIFINEILRWVGCAGSVIGIIVAIYLHIQRKRSFSLSTMFLSSSTNEIREPQKSTIISTLAGLDIKQPQHM